MKLPKMLTIKETATVFGLPFNFVRRAVLDNRIVYVKAGKKYLINAEKFAEWLNAGEQPAEPEPNSIRRIQ